LQNEKQYTGTPLDGARSYNGAANWRKITKMYVIVTVFLSLIVRIRKTVYLQNVV